MKERGIRRGGVGQGEGSQRHIPQSHSQIESAGANAAYVLPLRCAAIYIYMNNIWLVKVPQACREYIPTVDRINHYMPLKCFYCWLGPLYNDFMGFDVGLLFLFSFSATTLQLKQVKDMLLLNGTMTLYVFKGSAIE